MMCHIEDALPLSLLLHRGTAALNTLPYLAPATTHFAVRKVQHELVNSTSGKPICASSFPADVDTTITLATDGN